MAYNEKTKKATLKYRAEHIRRIPVDMQIEEYEKVKAYARARGETLSGFVKRAIRETMQSDY